MRTAGLALGPLLAAVAVLLRSPSVQAQAADESARQVEPTQSIVAEYVPQAAPAASPPPYTLLRYTENYRYLADATQRHEPLDRLKYIALGDAPGAYLSLGGEWRERFESLRNAPLGPSPQPPDPAYVLQRVSLHADLHADEQLRLFAQAESALQFGQTDTASAVNQNPLDLQQGFADYTVGDAQARSPRLTTRLGRFEMSYGAGRLIATRAAPNVPFRFDGLQVIAAQGTARLYGFAAHPLRERKYGLDTQDGGRALWGLYGTTPLNAALRVDAYYLGARYRQQRYVSGSGAELRQTLGLRLSGTRGHWDYDWEPVLQWGRFAQQPIRAWTLATDSGYRVGAVRLGLKLDIASGAKGGSTFGGFNPLYFKAGYFNDASIIRPSNIIDVHPSLQWTLSRSVTLTAASDRLWRYSLNDGVYAPSGAIELRPVSGASRAVGQTAELALAWTAGRHVSGAVSWTHLYASDAVRRARGDDVDYLGSWISLIW